MRVIVDDIGRYVGFAYTGTVLQPDQKIVDLTPADVDKVLAGARWEPMQEVLDANRAWRDNALAAEILALDPGADPVPELTARQLLRIIQSLIRVTQRYGRELNTLIRSVQFGTNPGLVIEGDDDFGPGA